MAEEKKNEVALSFGEMLESKLDAVESALPTQFNKARFIQNSLSVLNSNPDLAKANKAQLQLGLMKGAFLGLDFMNNECYLVGYGGNVNFQTSYRGEIKFVKRYSTRPIKEIYSKVVREGDEFEEKIIDGLPTIDFKPKPFNDGELMGVFAVCLYQDGTMIYETMSAKEVQSVRDNYSKAKNSPAWRNSTAEMFKKVCLRRLCKHIPTDFESVEAQQAWNEASDTEFTTVVKERDDSVVDVFAEEVPNVVDEE